MTLPDACTETRPVTRRWLLGGRVQGVGFRPHVCRIAHRLGLRGWVRNHSGVVEILAHGAGDYLDAFATALFREAPAPARVRLLSAVDVREAPPAGFTILDSDEGSQAGGAIAPDLAICDACRREIDDPADRRYRHAFASCAACGPRYTLLSSLPWDRLRTAMSAFTPCPACRGEYRDHADRRHHAQTLACPACGPRLSFRDRDGADAHGPAALDAAAARLRAGAIVAVKGLGGYHLLCDATDAAVVDRLRRTKPRPDQPFAVMFPFDPELAAVRACVDLDPVHIATLRDPAAPIVLAPLRAGHRLAGNVAPALGEVGVLLPYSALHHLLLGAFGGPLVATSANPHGEPVLTGAADVEERLSGVIDACLHHDRAILRPADDPVRRVIAGAARPLRLGRGDAPLEIRLPFRLREPLLAVGAHMKNTIALGCDDRVLISPHLGAPDSPRGRALFEQTIASLQALHGIRARRVACDAHPGYPSSAWARASGLPLIEVFHHRAHAAAVAGESGQSGPWLVFTWDGIGYGEDGTLWGGEALYGTPGDWRRVASLRPLRIPGGERAGRAPWLSALALCLETGCDWRGAPADAALAANAWHHDVNCAVTSSAGRLFDAAAALTGVTLMATHEGQGPMRLEALAATALAELRASGVRPPELALVADERGLPRSDWSPLVALLLDDARPPAERAALFHEALAAALLAQARLLRERLGAFTVGLCGGVFQNRVLTETVLALLAADGFDAVLPSAVPVNDAGIAFGQIVEAACAAGLAVR